MGILTIVESFRNLLRINGIQLTSDPKYVKAEINHLAAARRSYKLGKYADALDELQKSEAERDHQHEILELRWSIHADQGEWTKCVDIARTMTLIHPDEPLGWLCLADSIRNVPGGTAQMSYDILSSAVRRIQAPILYSALARYCTQLGRFEEKRRWEAKTREAEGFQGKAS